MEETIKSIVLGLCSGGIYALLAISYVVIYKSTRVFPFSQAAVLIIGAYIMWYCLIAWHLPYGLDLSSLALVEQSWGCSSKGHSCVPW